LPAGHLLLTAFSSVSLALVLVLEGDVIPKHRRLWNAWALRRGREGRDPLRPAISSASDMAEGELGRAAHRRHPRGGSQQYHLDRAAAHSRGLEVVVRRGGGETACPVRCRSRLPGAHGRRGGACLSSCSVVSPCFVQLGNASGGLPSPGTASPARWIDVIVENGASRRLARYVVGTHNMRSCFRLRCVILGRPRKHRRKCEAAISSAEVPPIPPTSEGCNVDLAGTSLAGHLQDAMLPRRDC